MKRPRNSAANAAQRHDSKMRAATCGEDGLVWLSPWERPIRLEGMGWKTADRAFRRMPLQPAWPLPKSVDDLAWHTAGVQARFRTDSKRVCLRVKLRGVHAMDHMPATGESGFDAYIGDVGSETYAGTARFNRALDAYQVTLCSFPTAAMRTVTINFPLYQGVHEVSIGIEEGARTTAAPKRAGHRPVVVYGTSITQGGCASRPGMAYTNILSRRIDCEFVNLGFSGSGRGEPEVAHVSATLPPPALFVMDYEANCGGLAKMRETLPAFLAILRKRWPRTPLLVVSRIAYAREAFAEAEHQARLERREFQRETVARLRRAGDKAVAFFDGGALLGEDFTECSVDGVHQTDLGFLRMANGLERTSRKLLTQPHAG